MRQSRTRTVILCASAAVLALWPTASTTAASSTEYLSYLRFPDSSPSQALAGPSPKLRGEVEPKRPDLVEFQGRAVIDVGSSSTLNPGARDFAFGGMLRLTRGSGDWNIMQKGYWGDPGQWKLSLDRTAAGLRFSCRVKGSQGAVVTYSPVGLVTAPGDWVRVECQRDGSRVSVEIDGRVVGVASGAIGTVTNTSPYLIGSKGTADDPDQFLGLMDYVWLRAAP